MEPSFLGLLRPSGHALPAVSIGIGPIPWTNVDPADLHRGTAADPIVEMTARTIGARRKATPPPTRRGRCGPATRDDPLGYDVRAEILGSRDSVAVGLGPRTPIRSLEPSVRPPAVRAWPDFLNRFEHAYRAELAAFVRVAGGETPSPCTARDGVEALRVAEATTTSMLENRVVRLAEIPG